MRPELPPIHEIWVYLAGSPLFALVLTLGAYALGLAVYERTQRNPLANPVLIAVLLLALATTVHAETLPGASVESLLAIAREVSAS